MNNDELIIKQQKEIKVLEEKLKKSEKKRVNLFNMRFKGTNIVQYPKTPETINVCSTWLVLWAIFVTGLLFLI